MTTATDWILCIEGQASEDAMNTAWDNETMHMLMWTTARNDDRTFVWVQMKEQIDETAVDGMFPDLTWCGVTTAAEEVTVWLNRQQHEPAKWRGGYTPQPKQDTMAGRLFLEELLAEIDSDRTALEATLEQILHQPAYPLSDQEVLWIAEGRL